MCRTVSLHVRRALTLWGNGSIHMSLAAEIDTTMQLKVHRVGSSFSAHRRCLQLALEASGWTRTEFGHGRREVHLHCYPRAHTIAGILAAASPAGCVVLAPSARVLAFWRLGEELDPYRAVVDAGHMCTRTTDAPFTVLGVG